MNIASIKSPGAMASPFEIASASAAQSFVQQLGAGPLSPATPTGIVGLAPVDLALATAAPIVLASDMAVPVAPPAGPGVEVEALAASPLLGPQGAKLLPADIAATSDEAMKAPPAGDLPPNQTAKTAATKAIVAPPAGGARLAEVPESAKSMVDPCAQDIRGSTDNMVGFASGDERDETPQRVIEPETPSIPTSALATTSQAPTPTSPFMASVTAEPTMPALAGAPAATSTDATRATTSAAVEGAAPQPGNGIADRALVDPAGLARPGQAQPQSEGLQHAPIGAASAPVFAARLAEAYPPAAVPPPIPAVEALPGRIGQDMGIEIARSLLAGKEELTVRLNPADLGRIEVRMGFDDSGSIRAVVVAESPVALELLRRDAGDLARALGDAGIRSDAQSFRFDARGGDAGQSGQRSHQGGRHQHHGQGSPPFDGEQDAPIYRPLRTSGRVDLFA